jgi:ribosomal protein S16
METIQIDEHHNLPIPSHAKWSSKSVSPASASGTNHSTTSLSRKHGPLFPSSPYMKPPTYSLHISRTARDSRPMEVLGTYDPTPRIPLPRPDDDPVLNPSAEAQSSGSSTPAQTSPVEKMKQKRYKDLQLDTIRTKYWLGVGAQPSEPVWRLFSMVSAVEWGGSAMQR